MNFTAKRRDGSVRVVDLSPKSTTVQRAQGAVATVERHKDKVKRGGSVLRDVVIGGAGAATAGAIEGVTGEVYHAGPIPVDAGVAVAALGAGIWLGGPAMHLARFANGVLGYRIGEAVRAKCESMRLEREAEAAEEAAKLAAAQAPAPAPAITVEETPAAQLEREDAELVARLVALRAKRAELAPAAKPAVAPVAVSPPMTAPAAAE